MHGMRLRDFQFGFALGTAQNLAFFDFIFVDINFSRALRATDHGSTLRNFVHTAATQSPRAPPCSVLYTAAVEFKSWECAGCLKHHRVRCLGSKNGLFSRVPG